MSASARAVAVAGDRGDASEVVALVEIERAEHLVGLHRHGREQLNAVGAAALVQAHHAIVETGRGVRGRHARESGGWPAAAVARAGGCRLRLRRVVDRATPEALPGDERDECDERDRGDAPRQGGREASLVAAAWPAGVPHRWQNFAPGVSCAPHDAQARPTRAPPQVEQNLPVAAAPHDGHVARPAVPGNGAGA